MTTVNEYLISQLNKLTINDFFGLPGDYNFDIIDAVENNPDTNWIGCTNELNAGYAADGYARAKGYGALITTFGVGELSAINAIAGSFAESVPVISIVGAPSTKLIRNNSVIHHNFCKPDYYAFKNAFSNVVEEALYLSAQNAKEDIDNLLSIFINTKKPVYIAIPTDIGNMQIQGEPDIKYSKSDNSRLYSAQKHAIHLINNAKNPVIVAGVLINRFFANREFENFLKESNIPATTLLMGKGTVDETSGNFIGTYLGSLDNQKVYEYVNNSDCVISIGTIYSDFNTLGYDINVNFKDFIEIQGNHTTIENETYENVKMTDILSELSRQVKKYNNPIEKSIPDLSYKEQKADIELTFEYILPRFQEFLKENDRLVVDTGIMDFFVPALSFPKSAKWYDQIVWASIGWATPGLMGAMLADKKSRHILLTGEGSHQVTFQVLSDIIRQGLKPIIIVLNNSGYTIERMISDNENDSYNDIAPWDYTKLARAFSENIYSAKAKTIGEFDKALNDIENNTDKLCYLEIFTPMMDLPYIFRKMRERIDSLK